MNGEHLDRLGIRLEPTGPLLEPVLAVDLGDVLRQPPRSAVTPSPSVLAT